MEVAFIHYWGILLTETVWFVLTIISCGFKVSVPSSLEHFAKSIQNSVIS